METQATNQILLMKLIDHLGQQMPGCLAQEWQRAMSNVMAEAHRGDLTLVWPRFVVGLLANCELLGYESAQPATFDAIFPVFKLYQRARNRGLDAVSSEEWREAAEHADQVLEMTALRDAKVDPRDHYVTVSYGPWGCRKETESDLLADWTRVAAAAARWEIVATIEHAVSAMPQQDKVWSTGWPGGWSGNRLAKYLQLASMLHSQMCEMNIDWDLQDIQI